MLTWSSVAIATMQRTCGENLRRPRPLSFANLRMSAQDHPVWFSRPYKVFLKTPDEVRGRIQYVELNPEKEGLSRQQYAFVQQYNNWPFHKIKSGMLPR